MLLVVAAGFGVLVELVVLVTAVLVAVVPDGFVAVFPTAVIIGAEVVLGVLLSFILAAATSRLVGLPFLRLARAGDSP